MENETKATLGAALAAGYVLGRTKKGKVAVGAASLLAGQGLLTPKKLITRALHTVAESPQAVQLLGQVRGELMDSARSALSTTADRGLGALADSLQQRTESLVRQPDDEEEEPAEDSEDSEAEGEEQPDDEQADDEQADDEEEREEETEAPPARSAAKKKAAAKRPGAGAPPAKKAPAGKKAAASKKPAGKKSAASKPAGKKTAAGRDATRSSRRR
ncbi:hypothetical protein [Streptomyces sp. NPDC047829]|uniref:hypothetical protein n=1 Tax=Streptomyces sp. NPDC047829 TaxID=3154609 RepID=UPI0033E72470